MWTLISISYLAVVLVAWRPAYVACVKVDIKEGQNPADYRAENARWSAFFAVIWPVVIAYAVGKFFMTNVIMRDTAAEVLYRAEQEQKALEEQATNAERRQRFDEQKERFDEQKEKRREAEVSTWPRGYGMDP